MLKNNASVIATKIVEYFRESPKIESLTEFLEINARNLQIFLDPSMDVMPCVQLSQTFDYWRGLPVVDGVPDTTVVEPENLVKALGNLMLVDVVDGGDDLLYALYGSNIALVSGFDMTGKSVWEVPTTSDLQVFFVACYIAALELRKPLYTIHRAPPHITISDWHRLILPMGKNGEIRRFLVCNVPFARDDENAETEEAERAVNH